MGLRGVSELVTDLVMLMIVLGVMSVATTYALNHVVSEVRVGNYINSCDLRGFLINVSSTTYVVVVNVGVLNESYELFINDVKVSSGVLRPYSYAVITLRDLNTNSSVAIVNDRGCYVKPLIIG